MQTDNKRDYRYEAFISYRHISPDDRIAKALQNKIENYRIPTPIRKKTGQKRLGKVFRDREELPTSGNLGDDITAALEASRWLIVICSPEMPRSKWCMEEVNTFIVLGRRERILTLLVQGEPEQSFPPQLRYMDDGRGGVTEIEPLAADVRAKSSAEMRRKLKTEKLRLLAPILGVGFDDLKRRSRERAVRRALIISLAATALFAAFGLYAADRALTIARQNDEIVSANAQITETNEALETQIGQTQLSQSRFLTSLAREEYESGNELTAVQLALAALPGDFDDPERPVYRGAVAMLRQIELKNDYTAYRPAFVIEPLKGSFPKISLSPDGQYIGYTCLGHNVDFYSAADGTRIENDPGDALYMNSSNADLVFFPDGTRVFLGDGDLAAFKDGKTGPIQSFDGDYYCLSGDASVLAGKGPGTESESGTVLYDNSIIFVDPVTLEIRKKILDDMRTIHCVSLTYDGTLAACCSDHLIKVVKTEDFSEVFSASDTGEGYRFVQLSPDGRCLASRQIVERVYDPDTKVSYDIVETAVHDIGTGDTMLNVDAENCTFSPDSTYFATGRPDNTVEIYDTATWQLLRSLQGHTGAVTGIVFSADGSLMVTAGEDRNVMIWDTADFSLLDRDSGTSDASAICISDDNSTIVIEYGEEIKVLKKTEHNPLVTEFPFRYGKVGQTGDIFIGDDSIDLHACIAYDRNTMQPLPEMDVFKGAAIGSLTLSPDRSRAITTNLLGFAIWDMTAGRKLMEGQSPKVTELHWPTTMEVIGYSKDGETVYCYLHMLEVDNQELAVFDAETGEEYHRMALYSEWQRGVSKISFDPCKSQFLLADEDGLEVYDTGTFERIRVIPVDYEDMWIEDIFLAPREDVSLIRLGSETGQKVKAYDTGTGGFLYQLYTQNEFNGITFMRDGSTLMLKDSHQLKQIDLYSGETVSVMAEPRESDLLYDSKNIILSRDEKMIACRGIGDDLSEVEVWDIGTGGIVARIEMPPGNVSMYFVKDDSALLVCAGSGYDHDSLCYELRDDKTVAENARENLVRELTPQERKRYFLID